MSDHQTVSLYIIATLCGFLAFFCPGLAPAVTVLDSNSKMPFDTLVAGNQNGWQLDVNAGTAIIGGPGNSTTGIPSGLAQIFYNDPENGWTHQYTLTSNTIADPKPADNDQLGFGVAIDQGVAVVSALQNQTVYVFDRDGEGVAAGWSENVSARLSMPLAINHFGIDVGVGNGQIIVGSGAGEAYIHTIGEVWEGTPLPASGKTMSFGGSVGISGTNAIVGDPGANAAYLYHLTGSGWVEVEEEPFSKPGGSFGSSVRISGDYAIVGGPTGQTDNGNTGMAAIYHRDPDTGTWSEEDTLTASDGMGYDLFGSSVDIGENYAIVGASGAWAGGDLGSYCGVSYVFQRNGSTWTEIEKLEPQDGDWFDYFGSAVAIDDDGDTANFIVGAYAHDSGSEIDTGAAYTHMLKRWMPGDADRDDDVDETDAATLAANWLGGTDVTWGEGDFNTDGIVDAADATLMATNWHYGVAPTVSVPEPATLLLMALGGLCLLFAVCRKR